MSDDPIWFPSLSQRREHTALVAGDVKYSYAHLDDAVNSVVCGLLKGQPSLEEERIGFLYPAGIDYAALIIGVVAAGGIAVPLSVHASVSELAHCLLVSGVKRLLLPITARSPELDSACIELGIEQLSVTELTHASAPASLPISQDQGALIVFTSGTTGKPKGVLHTVASVTAMVTSLTKAWAWDPSDVIPLFLPLHHVHGIVNVLLCGLWNGATVYSYPRFDAVEICEAVQQQRFTVFMAVPTVYVKIIAHLKTLPMMEREDIIAGFRVMRLNISGSAACPVSLFKEWEALTSQRFLERYGMTELGMALSNPYQGERIPGQVGSPLPGVEIKRVSEAGERVDDPDVPGELAVKSPTTFREYWGNPEATDSAFVDGWFLTGDIAVIEASAYRILGRASIDIIKSGGYKLSALEIEAALLEHPNITEAAVIGVPDDEWGETVAAALVVDRAIDADVLSQWCIGKMSNYKVPRRWVITETLPRNALGKVTKPALKAWFA